MQYTSRCQGISMGGISMEISMELAERDHSGCGGSLRYGIFSRSLTSFAEVAKPMGWTIHSTVPFPMLEHRETVHQLSRLGVGAGIYFSGSTLDRLTPGAAGAAGEALRSARPAPT